MAALCRNSGTHQRYCRNEGHRKGANQDGTPFGSDLRKLNVYAVLPKVSLATVRNAIVLFGKIEVCVRRTNSVDGSALEELTIVANPPTNSLKITKDNMIYQNIPQGLKGEWHSKGVQTQWSGLDL